VKKLSPQITRIKKQDKRVFEITNRESNLTEISFSIICEIC
jgi:hypothetical protein